MRLTDGLLDAAVEFGAVPIRDVMAIEIFQEAAAQGFDLVEVWTAGASFCQDAYERLAGPKTENGRVVRVGVTLRCEPSNEFDENAIVIESMGLFLGRVERRDAAILAPLLQAHCGGAIEGRGVIVGGWRSADSEGFYGIRVWLTSDDMQRLHRPM